MANIYDVGDLVQITMTFTNSAGELADPTAVQLTVQTPERALLTPTVTNPGPGTFTAAIPVTEAGTWRYRAAGTGVVQAATDSFFEVRPQTF
jgi:hypothetical protein